MTHRIYYDDSYCRGFEATVVRVEPRDGRQAVRLDRSAFYPTSGGQPFDTGALDATAVVDVEDEGDDVLHLVEAGAPLVSGQIVRGAIDWRRRFDHMQQHTGQHLLSAAFVHVLGVATVSFHMGAEVSTIDLERQMTAAEIADAETAANDVVWEGRAVTVSYRDAADASTLGLRKASARSGMLRLVEIENFDLSACGGTHVRHTGEIGMIAVTGAERFKGGTRLEFVCGRRALERFRWLRETTASAVSLLSVLPQEIPAAIERLQSELHEQKRVLRGAGEELAELRAERLMASAEPFQSGRAVYAIVDAGAQELKDLALVITRTPAVFVALVSREGGLAIVARSRESAPSVRCDDVVRALTARFGGRGGGRPDMAQAGGLSGTSQDALDAIRAEAGRG